MHWEPLASFHEKMSILLYLIHSKRLYEYNKIQAKNRKRIPFDTRRGTFTWRFIERDSTHEKQARPKQQQRLSQLRVEFLIQAKSLVKSRSKICICSILCKQGMIQLNCSVTAFKSYEKTKGWEGEKICYSIDQSCHYDMIDAYISHQTIWLITGCRLYSIRKLVLNLVLESHFVERITVTTSEDPHSIPSGNILCNIAQHLSRSFVNIKV